LPTSLKFVNGEAKYLLRRILRGNVPSSVLNRPKQGFAIPLSHWFRSGWQDRARPFLLEGGLADYFDRRCVERMLTEHTAGLVDHGEHLWLLLMFAAWREQYLSPSRLEPVASEPVPRVKVQTLDERRPRAAVSY
jgi:asparagine synthase (glutamine-hydrolysing)